MSHEMTVPASASTALKILLGLIAYTVIGMTLAFVGALVVVWVSSVLGIDPTLVPTGPIHPPWLL